MAPVSVAGNWEGVLATSSQVISLNLGLLRLSGPHPRLNAKRTRCTYRLDLSEARQQRQGRDVHRPVVHQPRIYRWPSASNSSQAGVFSKLRFFDKHALRFSNSGVFRDRRHVLKLLHSTQNSSSSSSLTEDEGDTEAGFTNCVEEGEEAGHTNNEHVAPGDNLQSFVTETEIDGDESSVDSQLGRTRNFISSVVRMLSGASFREQQSIIHHDMERSGASSRNPLRLFFQADPSQSAPWRKTFADGWRRAEVDFFAFSRQLGKYVFIMSGTGAIFVAGLELGGGSPHEQGVLCFSWLTGVVVGSMIGAGQVLKEHAMAGRRNVIITGSTRGLGKALAREFLRHGDNVVITSRSADSVYSTVEELRREIRDYSGSLCTSDARMELFGLPSPKRKDPEVIGIACDVSKSADVQLLANYAAKEFGTVDLWINNAGVNKGFRPLLEFSGEEIEQIVSTNLTGSMICTREAIKLMGTQKKGGHIFNMDGAGSGGSSTPLTAAYGATKCGLRQLSASLLQEVKGSSIGIHTASPGMVLTDLLLSGASLQNKKMFNFICEQPETVARALVPNIRLVSGSGKAVNYLTPARIVFAIVSLWIRRGRWFDEEGRAVYAAEAERLRLWAEGRERSPVTAAMELVPSGTWLSLFSSSVICAYIILTSASNGNLPGI